MEDFQHNGSGRLEEVGTARAKRQHICINTYGGQLVLRGTRRHGQQGQADRMGRGCFLR
jgi:hypothetical protein